MAIDVDGFAVLRSIVDNPAIFSDITAEINKIARAFVATQLKARTANLARVRAVHGAIGGEAFALVLDGFTDPAAVTLIKKLDKYHPELATASPAWRRQRIGELARGAAEPAPTPAPRTRRRTSTQRTVQSTPQTTTTPPGSTKPKVVRALSSKAMAAKWDGKDRED